MLRLLWIVTEPMRLWSDAICFVQFSSCTWAILFAICHVGLTVLTVQHTYKEIVCSCASLILMHWNSTVPCFLINKKPLYFIDVPATYLQGKLFQSLYKTFDSLCRGRTMNDISKIMDDLNWYMPRNTKFFLDTTWLWMSLPQLYDDYFAP
jgi:hypothetical protein